MNLESNKKSQIIFRTKFLWKHLALEENHQNNDEQKLEHTLEEAIEATGKQFYSKFHWIYGINILLFSFERNREMSNNIDCSQWAEYHGSCTGKHKFKLCIALRQIWLAIKHCRTRCFDFSVLPWHCCDVVFLGVPCRRM